jgi:hypothetical protein
VVPERAAPAERRGADPAVEPEGGTVGLPRFMKAEGAPNVPPDERARAIGLGASRTLGAREQTLFRGRLGVDPAAVRIHDGAQAAAAARALGARAFTVGTHVAFAVGAYRPDTLRGHLLLAHELAHVAQQRDARGGAPALQGDPRAERDADRAALSGTRPAVRLSRPALQRYPDGASAEDLIERFTSWGDLDEEALGQRLFELAWMSPNHYGFVVEVMDELGWGDRDDVASAFVRSARDDNLDFFATDATGRTMLLRLKRELTGGITVIHEGAEAIRLHHALRRAEGATAGAARAADVMTAAAERGRAATLDIAIPAGLGPAEIDDRLRLLDLLLERIRATHEDEDDVLAAVEQLALRVDVERTTLTAIVADPAWAGRRIAIVLEVAERCARNLDNLGVMLATYGDMSALGAASPPYVDLTRGVREAYLAALAAGMDDDALEKLSIAEALGAALPRALTEVDLGILAHRHAGYTLTEGYAQEMVAWVEWVRDRLEPLELEGRELAAARERGEPDLDAREAEFVRNAALLQYSISAIGDWERALRVWEALVGGGNVILGAYEDVNTILHRCQAMRDAAYAGDVDDLRDRLQRHQSDPAVERFYRAIPLFIGASAMLVGLGIALTAAMLSAGAGALIAGPGASTAAVAGSVAIEALTFTTVSRGLSGVFAPPPRMPFLLDLALNIGLFSLLRAMGSGIRSFLGARDLAALTGVATHTGSYAVLSGWGVMHFRLEEGRWPDADEIAIMSVQNLVMLAGIALASGAVTRAIHRHRELRALETFNTRYGTRLADIELARSQLRTRFAAELAAGRGDDPNVTAELRAEAEALNARLRDLVEEVRSDATIGIAELRSALADRAIDRAAVGGELLARTLGVAERVGLQRAGGANLYTYEAGATEPLVERLFELGASVSDSVDASGRRTVVAEIEGQAPMLFVERAVSAELTARLAELAGTIETSGSTREQRQDVIGALRTPHNAERGELEGFVLDTVLAENQRAFAELITTLRTENPDIIVGMERGGAFLADVVGSGDADLGPRVRHMPVHLDAEGKKFDGPAMQAEFQRLIDSEGASRIAIVDSYMGGTTASALRDQVLLPLARTNPGVRVDVHWMRETLGFEAGGTMGALRGVPRRGTPGGVQIEVDQRQMRLVLGDDMEIVYTPDSREPITIFDRDGRILRAEYPRPGETTRDVLIRLLRPAP